MSAGASEENVTHNLLKSEMNVNLIMYIILTTIGSAHNQDTIHLIFFPFAASYVSIAISFAGVSSGCQFFTCVIINYHNTNIINTKIGLKNVILPTGLMLAVNIFFHLS